METYTYVTTDEEDRQLSAEVKRQNAVLEHNHLPTITEADLIHRIVSESLAAIVQAQVEQRADRVRQAFVEAPETDRAAVEITAKVAPADGATEGVIKYGGQ